jgi:hypothetical protein
MHKLTHARQVSVPLQYSAPDAFAAINATLHDASAHVAACLNANAVSCAEGPGYNWTQVQCRMMRGRAVSSSSDTALIAVAMHGPPQNNKSNIRVENWAVGSRTINNSRFS